VKIQAPRGIAVDKQDRIWVLSSVGDSLVRFGVDKSKETVLKGTPFEFPNQLALDPGGRAVLCDNYAGAVWSVSEGKEPEKLVSGEPLNKPVGIVCVEDGFLVADPHAKAIFHLSLDGKMDRTVFPKR
jgi:sugar lactone lactonase YvrE